MLYIACNVYNFAQNVNGHIELNQNHLQIDLMIVRLVYVFQLVLYSSTANQIKLLKNQIFLVFCSQISWMKILLDFVVSKNCTQHGNIIFSCVCWGGGWFMYDSEEETFSLSIFMWKVSKKESIVVYCVAYILGI